MSRLGYWLVGGGLIVAIGLLLKSHAAAAAEPPKKSGQTDGPGSNLTNPPDTVNTKTVATQNLSAEVLIPGAGLSMDDPDFKVSGRNMTEPT